MTSVKEYAVVLGLVVSAMGGIAAGQVADKPDLRLDGAKQVIAAAIRP